MIYESKIITSSIRNIVASDIVQEQQPFKNGPCINYSLKWSFNHKFRRYGFVYKLIISHQYIEYQFRSVLRLSLSYSAKCYTNNKVMLSTTMLLQKQEMNTEYIYHIISKHSALKLISVTKHQFILCTNTFILIKITCS